jgi:hypothetical protein
MKSMKFFIIVLLTLFSTARAELFSVQGMLFERVTMLGNDGSTLNTVFVPVNQALSKSIDPSTIISVPPPSSLTYGLQNILTGSQLQTNGNQQSVFSIQNQ